MPSELPAGVARDDVAAAVRAVTALTAAGRLDGADPAIRAVTTELRRLGRSRNAVTRNWVGGGGYRTVTVGRES